MTDPGRAPQRGPGGHFQSAIIMEPERDVRVLREARQSAIITSAPSVTSLALPGELQDELHKFQIAEYAHQFFRSHRAGKLFSRKKIPVDQLACFQATALSEPLLGALAKNAKKPATDCFKQILAYSGADPGSKSVGAAAPLNRLVSTAVPMPELRDEIYFQLIKQTRECPLPEVLQRTWELFLVMASIFPSSRNSEVWIKSHLWSCAKGENRAIADIAHFAYIRFNARCHIGKPLDSPTPELCHQFIADRTAGHATFGASIYEQFWNQRATHPKMLVPRIIHEMAEALLAKGAEQSEGIFRLSGNLRKVKEMEQQVNEGKNPIPEAVLNDLASLFKSWFASLPEPLVAEAQLPALKAAFETRKHLEFVQTLPSPALYTLKYLVGFLQRLVQAQEVTKMTPKNFAIVFAPNLVYSGAITDPQMLTAHGEISQDFIITLIAEWDVRDVYPAPPTFFEGAREK
jgi:hypothetical protein